jgi:hypothetical protein
VATETPTDQAFAARVTAAAPGFTPRMARELREIGLLTPGGAGGQGKATDYTEDDERSAAAWQQAKGDPDYRQKSDHAVLIAYAREAPVRIEGLRWAWRTCYDRQRDQIIDQAGMRVREPSWAGTPAPVRRALSRVAEAAEHGEPIPRRHLNKLLDNREPAILESVAQLVDVLAPFYAAEEIAELRAAVESVSSTSAPSSSVVFAGSAALRPRIAASIGDPQKLARYLGTRAARIVAEEADRELLDEVRDGLLFLRTSPDFEPFSGLSDWELSVSVPHIALASGMHDGKRRRSPSRP